MVVVYQVKNIELGKTQNNTKLRRLASDLNFNVLHTGCPIAHDQGQAATNRIYLSVNERIRASIPSLRSRHNFVKTSSTDRLNLAKLCESVG